MAIITAALTLCLVPTMVIISADPCEQQKLLQLTLLYLYALFDVSDYSLMSLMTDESLMTLVTL